MGLSWYSEPAMHELDIPDALVSRCRTLIVRGDLRSQNGWSRATRALVDLLRPHFVCVFGIDLHFSPSRSILPAPFHLIRENDIDLLIDVGARPTLLNLCLPHEFRHVPGARNIGYFFWESDKPPAGWNWIEFCSLMDQLWVPTDWQREVVTSWLPRGNRADIRVIPWPHRIYKENRQSPGPPLCLNVHRALSSAELCRVEVQEETIEARSRIPWLGRHVAIPSRRRYQAIVLSETCCALNLANTPGPLVFALQTDVPRKGLAVLISEWLQFRRSRSDAVLLIKLSSIDVTKDTAALHVWLSRQIRDARLRIGAPDDRIFACYEHLNDFSLTACYRAASAFISATFGEGFGGPIVESVLAGALPVVPTHTACAALLPDKYPFAVETDSLVGKLVGQLPIYPASGRWHVPVDGALARQLSLLFSADHETRAHWLQLCRNHLRIWLSPDVVASKIADALLALEQNS
jgi:glycosyltransferase involved in cell wall biosynthesis